MDGEHQLTADCWCLEQKQVEHIITKELKI